MCVGVALVVALVGISCVPSGPTPCDSAGWCALPGVGTDGPSGRPSIDTVLDSGDVLFATNQTSGLTTDLDPSDLTPDVFLYRRASGSYLRESDAGGAASASMSPDGRYLAVQQWEQVTQTASVRLYDSVTHTTQVIFSQRFSDIDNAFTSAPFVAADGGRVVWSYRLSEHEFPPQVAVWSPTGFDQNTTFGTVLSVDSVGMNLDIVGGAGLNPPNYFRFSSNAAETIPSRSEPFPGQSTVDGTKWITPNLGPSDTVQVLDTTTSTTEDLGLPVGITSTPGTTYVVRMSGDGHHVAISDGTRIWVRST
jgi:hypothetical protein